jgi:formylmethanofuran dehydrogenase subunit E
MDEHARLVKGIIDELAKVVCVRCGAPIAEKDPHWKTSDGLLVCIRCEEPVKVGK